MSVARDGKMGTLGERIGRAKAEDLASKLPGYVKPGERALKAAEEGRQREVQEKKKAEEFVQENSIRLASSFLAHIIVYLDRQITASVRRDDEGSLVTDNNPRDHYGPEQLRDIPKHVAQFRSDLAELSSQKHLLDREQELRYARAGFRINVGGLNEFLQDIGLATKSHR